VIQVTQGYNIYWPLDKYFYNYQNITVSDMTSYSNARDYRLCFVGQAEKTHLQMGEPQPLFSSLTQVS
jgi:hypothetical protein